MINLASENDPEVFFTQMRHLQQELKPLQKFKDIHDAFFHVDDVTIGLLHLEDLKNIEIDEMDITLKLIKVIHRSFLKGFKTDEKEMAKKAFKQINRFNSWKIQQEHIHALEQVPFYLEIEPQADCSLELCYRKFGELHSNIRQKRFELMSLSYLNKYLSPELEKLSNKAMEDLAVLHKQFINAHPKSKERIHIDGNSPSEETLQELEISAQVLQNTLLSTEPGEKFFSISKKLRKINQKIAKKYDMFDCEVFENFTKILGSDFFKNIVKTLTELMLELREEQSRYTNIFIDPSDLQAIGITTGKTTMIDDYSTAIEEVLAPLSTFMSNTLHHLVLEMLQNTPKVEKEAREHLIRAYKATGKALDELEEEILSNSNVLK
jgi:hypothetical protein